MYVTLNGITLRKSPSTSGEKISYLSIGRDVKVLAKENGFYYVYYPRYGMYGWTTAKYIDEKRPVAEKEQHIGGVVSPDKKNETQKQMTVAPKAGLRLRKGPGTGYSVIRAIGCNLPVKVIGSSSKNPGWVYVYDMTHGVSGWVASAYLK